MRKKRKKKRNVKKPKGKGPRKEQVMDRFNNERRTDEQK